MQALRPSKIERFERETVAGLAMAVPARTLAGIHVVAVDDDGVTHHYSKLDSAGSVWREDARFLKNGFPVFCTSPGSMLSSGVTADVAGQLDDCAVSA